MAELKFVAVLIRKKVHPHIFSVQPSAYLWGFALDGGRGVCADERMCARSYDWSMEANDVSRKYTVNT